MKVTNILLNIQNMASSEVEDLIDPSVLEEIKRTDPHPFFKVFSVAHEGTSHGTVIGLGKVPLVWLQNAIEKIHERIELGTKLFRDHKKGTNEHAGRTNVGRVVGKVTKFIKGIQHALTIGYIEPDHKNDPLDIASFEGDILLPDNLTDNPVIDPGSIKTITGIALGDSKTMAPAFRGAVLQTALQMMSGENGGKQMEITFEMVRKFISENKVKPGSIFDSKDLAEDGTVKEIIKEGNKNVWYQNERLQKEKDELRVKLDDQESELKKENTKLKTDITKTTAVKTKDEILSDRKLDETIVKFVNRHYDKFEPKDGKDAPDVKTQLNSWLDSQIDEFKSMQDDGIIPTSKTDEIVPGAGENTKENKQGLDKAAKELDGESEE